MKQTHCLKQLRWNIRKRVAKKSVRKKRRLLNYDPNTTVVVPATDYDPNTTVVVPATDSVSGTNLQTLTPNNGVGLPSQKYT